MPSFAHERGTPEQIAYRKRVTSPTGVLLSQSDDVVTITMNFSEMSKQWVRTPNYWALRRSGANLPDNDFTFGRLRREVGKLNYEWDDRDALGNLIWRQVSVPTQWWSLTPAQPDIPVLDLMNKLIGEAKKSNFSLPVTLAEADRTVRMVRNAASTIAGTIFDLRRGNLSSALSRLGLLTTASQRRRYGSAYAKDPSRAAANAWLEYQYGWKPLLGDVKNAAEALAEAVSRNGDSMTTRVTAYIGDTLIQRINGAVIGSSPFTTGTLHINCRRKRKAVWRFKPRSADLPGLFGMTNPFEVIWEIVPFSFVADWFLPIGNYLSALDVPLRFTHVGGSTGYRKATSWTTFPTSVQHKDGSFAPSVGGQSATATEISVRRDRMVGLPEINLNQMYFQPRIGAARATTAIALLRQQASRL